MTARACVAGNIAARDVKIATAKAVGIAIPPSFLLRADDVIE
jgi:hypothetical protein